MSIKQTVVFILKPLTIATQLVQGEQGKIVYKTTGLRSLPMKSSVVKKKSLGERPLSTYAFKGGGQPKA